MATTDPPPPPARRRSYPVIPILTLLIAVVAFGSCKALGGALSGTEQQRTVVHVGDSITDSAQAELVAEGDRAGWTTTVDATPGAMTVEKQDSARGFAAREPTVATIHLGTNDAMCIQANRLKPLSCSFATFTAEDRDRDLTTMAATMRAAGACVIGVVPYVDLGVGRLWRRRWEERAIDGIADWGAEATAHQEEYLRDSLGHLTDAGRTAYARFVLDAVTRTCDPDAA